MTQAEVADLTAVPTPEPSSFPIKGLAIGASVAVTAVILYNWVRGWRDATSDAIPES